MLGKTGFRWLAEINLAKTEYLEEAGLWRCAASVWPSLGPTFMSLRLTVRGRASDVAAKLRERGIFAGVPLRSAGLLRCRCYPTLERTLLIAATERHRREDLRPLGRGARRGVPMTTTAQPKGLISTKHLLHPSTPIFEQARRVVRVLRFPKLDVPEVAASALLLGNCIATSRQLPEGRKSMRPGSTPGCRAGTTPSTSACTRLGRAR